MPVADPGVQRDADALRFRGELTVAGITALWPQALAALPGVRRFDLTGVGRVDSAGVALLSELAQRAGGPAIDGDPPGLSALRAAYRLTPALAFAS